MDRGRPLSLLALRTAYPLICLAIMALRLMPHHLTPGGWPGPDLLIAVTFAWVLRRPEQVPLLIIAAVCLTADLLYQRPPGAMAALMVVACELLRGRGQLSRPLLPVMEWGLVAIVVLAMCLAHWMVLGLTLVSQPILTYQLWQAAMTVACYPLVVWVLRSCGLRKPTIVQGVIRQSRT